ncbi:hypothetical protein [Streptomyces sp. NPDC049555]|uniref:hypothetical protein n=1 Tax=Streptomyces sp. NPDC049555 TaxID=3154930 RepID=UPI0034404C88
MNAIDSVSEIRAQYGPDEHQAVELYSDVIDAFEAAGLPAYVETRGGLAVCAVAPDGSMFVIASEEALPWRRDALDGWHLSHAPEDEPGVPWRCTVYDTVAADLDYGAAIDVTHLVSAARAHLAVCPKAAR